MIPSPPPPQYSPGTRLKITQFVRVGHRRWLTQVEGVVVGEGWRPVGGIEMGGKTPYCHQKTLQLKRDSGELTLVTLDEHSQVQEISIGAAAAPPGQPLSTLA
jgi:hypothetical protein